MKAKFLTNPELPIILPHGWKKDVAKILGVHPNTIQRHIKLGKGDTYRKIVRAAELKYGEKKEISHES